MDRKNGIDLFRLIGAFFIMCLHTVYGSLNQEYVDIIRLLSRWAVPFYFIASGFFLGYKIGNNNLDIQRIQGNIGALISILIVSTMVYLPMNLWKGGVPKNVANILTGNYFHLWFIGALLTGYIFIWYIFYLKKYKLLPYISICILALALFTDSYDQLLGKNLNFELFRFLLAIPFMYVGIVISKRENISVSNALLIGLLLVGVAIQFIEAELFFKLFQYSKSEHQFLIGTIVTAIALFILSSKLTLKENIFSKWGRQYSLFIYLYHPLVYFFTWMVLYKIAPKDFDFIKMFSPIIGFTLSLTFSILLNSYFPRIFNLLNGNIHRKSRDKKVFKEQRVSE